MYEQLSKIQGVKAQLAKELNKDPTSLQISERIGLPKERVEEILLMSLATASLDQPMSSDGDSTSTLLDTLEVRRAFLFTCMHGRYWYQ